MTREELCEGSLVSYNGNVSTVTRFANSYFVFLDSGREYVNISILRPIPFDESYLPKLGFVEVMGNYAIEGVPLFMYNPKGSAFYLGSQRLGKMSVHKVQLLINVLHICREI